MQVLYQLDLRGEEDEPSIREGLADSPDSAEVCEAGLALALAAWATRGQADAIVAELAPDWPTHRQPPVDRAMLRLAYHEIASGHAPAKVVINEAVELAKIYGTDQSPAFINGVLDKAAKRLAGEPGGEAAKELPGAGDDAPVNLPDSPADAAGQPPKAPPKPTGDAWLDDALKDK